MKTSMRIRTSWLILISVLGLFSACREPIPSQPPPEDGAAVDAAAREVGISESEPTGPCRNEDFSACEYACEDSDCFEWCAGSRCVAALGAIAKCMSPASSGLQEGIADEERGRSEEVDAGYAAYEERWGSACSGLCRESIVDDCEGGICEDYWCDLGPRIGTETHFERLLSPPDPPRIAPRALGLAGDLGAAGSLSGSTLSLLGRDLDDPKQGALSRLVSGDWALAHELGQCVTKPPAAGKTFHLAVQLATDGVTNRVTVEHSGDSAADACVERKMGSFRLPARVARHYPSVRLELVARPGPERGGVIGVLHQEPLPSRPDPSPAEERAKKELELECTGLLGAAEDAACGQLAPLAGRVYAAMHAAGGSLMDVPNHQSCVNRLVDHTVRCASDPLFKAVIERASREFSKPRKR